MNTTACVETQETFHCSKCFKEYTRLSFLQQHEATCQGSCIRCQTCNKVFSSTFNFNRHKPRCQATAEELSAASAPAQNITINNINNIVDNSKNQITININVSKDRINAFGKETLEHLTPVLLNRCIKEIKTGVSNLVDAIHFDERVPENNNIRIQSVKGQTLAVYRDDGWVIQDMNEVINQLINNGCRILYNHYETSEDIQREDREDHCGILLRNLQNVNCKHPSVYYPTKRQIIAHLKTRKYKHGDLSPFGTD
jgi:hypothetical protein